MKVTGAEARDAVKAPISNSELTTIEFSGVSFCPSAHIGIVGNLFEIQICDFALFWSERCSVYMFLHFEVFYGNSQNAPKVVLMATPCVESQYINTKCT